MLRKVKGYFSISIKKTFSLIELIVVIVILGLLAAIVIPNVSTVREEAKSTAIISDSRNIQIAVDTFQLQNNDKYPVKENQPSLGKPQEINFSELYFNYLRSLPKHDGMYYWVDYQGKVWFSTIDNPIDFTKNAEGLTWTPNKDAKEYHIYEVTENTTGSLHNRFKHISFVKGNVGKIVPQDYDQNKTYLINLIDRFGFESAPVITNYSGITPYKRNDFINAPSKPESVGNSIRKVTTGIEQTFVVNENGELWSFGRNDFGQLGRILAVGELSSNPVKIMDGVSTVDSGFYHTLVVKENGELWSFGSNQSGQLGNGVDVKTTKPHPIPTKVLTGVVSVATSTHHSFVVMENGDLLSFGSNQHGQLGRSVNLNTGNPNYLAKLMGDVKSVDTGYQHTVILKKNGEVWTVGMNGFGQLGHSINVGNSSTPILNPQKVMDNVVSVAAGQYYTMAIKENGELWSFGWNQYGQLGHNANIMTYTPNPTPTKVMEDVASVSTSSYSTLVVKKNGELWSFGNNYIGQLGHNTNVGKNIANPTPIKIMDNVAFVSAEGVHSIAVKKNGEVWSFGGNNFGQLGHSTNMKTNIPNPIPTKITIGES